MATPPCKSALLRKLGRIGYRQALSLQQSLVAKYKSVKPSHPIGELLLLEHDPVYTFGLREKNFLLREDDLRDLGADVFKTRRGGLTTFHGPGQLVAYPVLNLKSLKIGVREYVKCLEDSVISTLRIFGVAGFTTDNVGVWVDCRGEESKICAIGIQVTHGMSYHGLALNCTNDLSWFSHITPCGVEGKQVTTLSQVLRQTVPVEAVEDVLASSLAERIGFTLHRQNTNEMKLYH